MPGRKSSLWVIKLPLSSTPVTSTCRPIKVRVESLRLLIFTANENQGPFILVTEPPITVLKSPRNTMGWSGTAVISTSCDFVLAPPQAVSPTTAEDMSSQRRGQEDVISLLL